MPLPTHTQPEQTTSNGTLAAWATVILVVATVLLGALLPARHGAQAPPVAEDLRCLEWTDGCRVCQRLAEGPACSLPGIACTTGEMRCLHRAGG